MVDSYTSFTHSSFADILIHWPMIIYSTNINKFLLCENGYVLVPADTVLNNALLAAGYNIEHI